MKMLAPVIHVVAKNTTNAHKQARSTRMNTEMEIYHLNVLNVVLLEYGIE